MAAKLEDVKARSGDIFGKEDVRMEHTLKRVIANGVDLKVFKKTETKESEPMIKVIAKPKSKAKPKNEMKAGMELKAEAKAEVKTGSEKEIKPRSELASEVKTESEKEVKPRSEPQSEANSETVAKPCKGKVKNTLGLVPLTYGEEDE